MSRTDLIYDRTQEDLKNNTAKAYYNYFDLNRIEEWCEYIKEELNTYNYFCNVTVKTDWTMYDLPTESEMERIRGNVNILKEAYYSYTNIPANLEKMTISKANAIEKILFEINDLIYKMTAEFRKCGTFCSGGMEGLI